MLLRAARLAAAPDGSAMERVLNALTAALEVRQQSTSCSGNTTVFGNPLGPDVVATNDAAAPKPDPNVMARSATLPPNAAQPPEVGWALATPGVRASAARARTMMGARRRMTRLLDDPA